MGRFSRSALILIIALLLIGQWASGQGWEAVVSGGYHQENLRWSIAGNSAGQSPNVYSELKWRQVRGGAVDAELRYGAGRRWVFFCEGSRVFTSAGRVLDRDYAGNNRTFPVYNQDFEARNGYSYSVAAGGGWRIWPGGRFELAPSVGYGVSGQHLTITDPGGLFTFLNSNYETTWFGPLVRGSAIWRIGGGWELRGGITYHQVSYRATADWNLISAFSHPVSFRHWADGFGVDGELGIHYRVWRRMGLLLAANGFYWETGKGIDEYYRSDGHSQQTQLNEVVLNGISIRIGGTWGF